MITKIKETLSTIFKYVLTPFLIVGGIIFYLVQRLNTVKSELATAKAEKDLAKDLIKIEEAKERADEKEANYIRTRDEYLNNDDGSGPDKAS